MEIIPVAGLNLIRKRVKRNIEKEAADVFPVPTLLPPTGYALLSLWMFAISLISILSNFLVIAVMLQNRRFLLPTNLLILSLSISDLLMTFCGSAIATVTNYYGQFFMGRQLCVFQGFMVNYFGLVSLCTLTLMAYERYYIVCKPNAAFKVTMWRSAKGLLLVWIYCLFWCTGPLLGWSSYGPEGVQTSCSLAWGERTWTSYSYLLPYWFFCFLLPTGIIIYCYYHIMISMKRLNLSVESQGGKPRQKEDRQLTCMVATMIGSFFFCWLPYAVVSIVVVIFPNVYIDPLLASMPAYLAKTSPVYNPLVFFTAKKEPRERAMKMILCGCYTFKTPISDDVKDAETNEKSKRLSYNSIQPEP